MLTDLEITEQVTEWKEELLTDQLETIIKKDKGICNNSEKKLYLSLGIFSLDNYNTLTNEEKQEIINYINYKSDELN